MTRGTAFDLVEACALLERTPSLVRAWLAGLPEPWIRADEGPDTWNHSSNRALTLQTPEGRGMRLMLDALGRMTSAVPAGVDSMVFAYDM